MPRDDDDISEQCSPATVVYPNATQKGKISSFSYRYHNVIISRVCVFGIEFAVNVLVCCKDIISQFSCTNNFVAVLRYRLDIIYC